ncbi:GNAT family N-acetyltransferase [Putridiphycobacter roseus]|uniref:GNAT family N-acetyltransferase n=1 Tax=Putridiphycobacter roseus TaxID=2219161 RepID=A0A2W1N0D5_9FLAO|nr:GNAT family N-acetyltransferase [Putridiphycobacter roseus]PZE16960.1 GNAT family N-acetyltransferase [Putridiphycobacter roseus]
MKESNAIIRTATPNDMQSVHALITELAVYENAADQMTNSVAQLIEDGFGVKKLFDCIVAELGGEVVGFALFYTSYSTWKGACLYLEDFLVTEKWRGKGIGKLLFDEVYQIAKKRKVGRFEWQVLDWNEPAINFYKKYHANLDPEWLNGKIIFD